MTGSKVPDVLVFFLQMFIQRLVKVSSQRSEKAKYVPTNSETMVEIQKPFKPKARLTLFQIYIFLNLDN